MNGFDLRALHEADHIEDLQEREGKLWKDKRAWKLKRTDFPHVVSNLSASYCQTRVALD